MDNKSFEIIWFAVRKPMPTLNQIQNQSTSIKVTLYAAHCSARRHLHFTRLLSIRTHLHGTMKTKKAWAIKIQTVRSTRTVFLLLQGIFSCIGKLMLRPSINRDLLLKRTKKKQQQQKNSTK